MPRAVIAEERLGHESDRFVVPLGDVAHDVFVILHVVGHHFQRREPDVDFGLARGRDFVMLALDRDAGFLQLEAHFVADVLQGVGRRRPGNSLPSRGSCNRDWETLRARCSNAPSTLSTR